MIAGEAHRIATLIVYYADRFVAPSNGSQTRVADFLRFAPSIAQNVIVYTYGRTELSIEERQRFASAFPGVTMVTERRSALLSLFGRVKNAVLQLAPRVGLALCRVHLPKLTPELDRLLRNSPLAPWMVNYVDGLAEINGCPADFIIETHDAKFLKYAKHKRIDVNSIAALLRLRSEIACLSASSGVIAIAPPEASMFRLLTGRPVYYVPRYGTHSPSTVAPAAPDVDLIFVGSGNAMNSRGLVAFLDTHREWLLNRRLLVCGRICDEPAVRDAAAHHPTVELQGYVESLAAAYDRAKVAISPVEGTGMKIKVMEALEHGLPVLASAHSLEGLPPGFTGAVRLFEEREAAALLDDASKLAAARSAVRNYVGSIQGAGDLAALVNELLSRTVGDTRARS